VRGGGRRQLIARVLATSADRSKEQLAHAMDALYATPLRAPIKPSTRRALRRLARGGVDLS
jgi:hypothetical protein